MRLRRLIGLRFEQVKYLQQERRLTMRAVDRWVRAAFFGVFAALDFFRFDGESRPTHLPLTRAVSPLTLLTKAYQASEGIRV